MDFSTVPLLALSIETKQLISTLLNPPKILPSDSGLPRDWRGLAHVLGMPGETIPSLATHSNPSDRIFESILGSSARKITIKDLQNALELIERWDVIDDTENLFEGDAQEHNLRIVRSQLSAEAIEENTDLQILTIDDQYRCRAGLDMQLYDGFLLYAEDDYEFAKEMLERLENDGLKICTQDRDLIAGLAFEHEAIMKLISERCNRLIMILSPSFVKSSANKFFLEYAQAVGIDKQQRKLIPCIYKDCELPAPLSYTNKINYSRRAYFDFWGKLSDSIRASPTCKADRQVSTISNLKNENKITIKACVETSSANPVQGHSQSTDNENSNYLVKETENKTNSQGTSEDIIEEQVSDLNLSLPSPPLDSVNFLQTDSDSKKKKKPKFMKSIFKKLKS